MDRKQVDLLIEDITESYQRQITELMALVHSKEKDIFNLRECLVLMDEMLNEKRGGN